MRLHPLHINELPAHPALDSLITTPSEHTESAGSSPSQAGKIDPSERPNLISFMEEILDQAIIFVDDTLPATFKEGSLETSKPATAKVRMLRRNISMAEIQAIPWINSSMYIPIDLLACFESRDNVSEVDICFSSQNLSRYSAFPLKKLC